MSSSSSSSVRSSSGSSTLEDKNSMCLSPQDKLKGLSKVTLVQRKKAQHQQQATGESSAAAVFATGTASAHASAGSLGLGFKTGLGLDMDMSDAGLMDLDLDLVEVDDPDQDMDVDAGWISDDNLRALDFDERLNQDIDWVTNDDVERVLKLDFVPTGDHAQDFAFEPSSFLSPLRGGLAFEDSDMSSSFAESLEVALPVVTSQDAEKLLMSFDTMNFTIPSPTSSSNKRKRASLFGKKDDEGKSAVARLNPAAKGSMSPTAKAKAGQVAGTNGDAAHKADPRASLSKITIPAADSLLGVLSISTPTGLVASASKKKIGSYSPEARKLRIQKFHEKRKNRTWKKSIKYDCRKKLADDRPRIKGRFVRVLENATDSKDDESSGSGVNTSSTSCSASTATDTPTSSPSSSLPASPAVTAATGDVSVIPVAKVEAFEAQVAVPSVLTASSAVASVGSASPLVAATSAVIPAGTVSATAEVAAVTATVPLQDGALTPTTVASK